MFEANELFNGWDEYPPTNILVKALVEGFGGGVKKKQLVDDDSTIDVPDEAFKAMQRSALAGIAARAQGRLPIIAGPDLGLPKSQPVFDIDEMRKRNNDVIARR